MTQTSGSRTILIMAGGTGGHIFPALSIAEYLRDQGYRVEWLGTRRGLEVQVLEPTGFTLNFLSVSGLRGKGVSGLLLAPLMLLRSTWQALLILRRIKPCCVLGMGGYVTGPGGVAAKLCGRPLLIHEQNAIAGFSNRMLARIADTVMQAFPGTFAALEGAGDKLLTTGNPVRREIRQIAPPALRQRSSGALRILVLGGSLGAVAINRLIPEVLARFDAAQRPVVVHQTGPKNLEETLQCYQTQQIALDEHCQVLPFIADMAAAYAAADLVICRAGATTISELAAAGLASVLVPYPHAVDDHQTRNAQWLTEAGAALLIPQSELSAEVLCQHIEGFIRQPDALLAMAEAARELGWPVTGEGQADAADATEKVAAQCMKACQRAHEHQQVES